MEGVADNSTLANAFFYHAPFPPVADWTVLPARHRVIARALKCRAALLGTEAMRQPSSLSHTERVRLEAIRLQGWGLVHVHFMDVEDVVPVLIYLLSKNTASRLLDMSLTDLETSITSGEWASTLKEDLAKSNDPAKATVFPQPTAILKAATAMDSYLVRVLKDLCKVAEEKKKAP